MVGGYVEFHRKLCEIYSAFSISIDMKEGCIHFTAAIISGSSASNVSSVCAVDVKIQ